MNNYNVAIRATGSYLPEKILTNADLEKIVQTTDEWITTRTGIKERRIADKDTATSDLAVKAAFNALERAKLSPEDIELIIVATATPDMLFPSTACFVQKALGAMNAAAFDLTAACSGFIYGMGVAKAFIESGTYRRILIIGAETLTKITDWQDRNTCVLFGDGAGAMILERTEGPTQLLSVYMGADGNYAHLLQLPGGGSRNPVSQETLDQRLHYMKMEGKEVFKVAVPKMCEAAQIALDKAGKKCEDLALLIPHQANMRIIEAIAKRINVPLEKVYINIQKYGNMSAATIIIALDEALRSERIKPGDLIEVVAFGGGFTWGASVIQF